MGLWIGASRPSRWESQTRPWLPTLIEEIARAEDLGWEDVWISEHPFESCDAAAASFPVAAAAAARTERLRIATALLPLPSLNPVRVAEDAATLDLLSAGRFELGLGVGVRGQGAGAVGAASQRRAARAGEAVEVVRRLLCGERIDFTGDHFDYRGLELHPRPLQRPPPIWMSGNSHAAATRAGAWADGFLGLGAAVEQIDACLHSAESAGRDLDRFEIAGGLPGLWVSRDPVARQRAALEHFATPRAFYTKWFEALGCDAGFEFATPERAAARLHRCVADQRLHRLLSFGVPAGFPAEWAAEHLELMAREVMPALREAPATPR